MCLPLWGDFCFGLLADAFIMHAVSRIVLLCLWTQCLYFFFFFLVCSLGRVIVLSICLFVGHVMYPELLMFEVHHGGRFNMEDRVTYVNEDISHYPDPYDRDELLFIETERVVRTYGYGPGDLIYYNLPTKSLDEGLRLISFDHDVIQMVEHHREHGIVELYLVAFGVVDVDVEVEVHGEEGIVDEEEEEQYERVSVYRSDPFWDQVLSDDSDAYDLDGDAEVGLEHDDVRVDEGFGLQPEDVMDQEVGVEAAAGEAEEGEGEGAGGGKGYSDIFGNDELISPSASDEEGAAEVESSRRPCVTKRVPFSKDDLKDPILQQGNTFQDVYEFRKAIKQASVLKTKDLTYQKNSMTKCIAVCADKNCKYRVYGKQLKDESTFILISIRPRHSCPRRYKNHLITSNMIAEGCMDCFKDHPNMPIDVLKKKVKNK